MFKTFTFNTNDASRECRYYLGINGTNSDTMRVSVCFHRTRTAEPISMSYMGGVIIKKGLPHWREFKVMLMECIARKEQEEKMEEEGNMMIGAMRTLECAKSHSL